MAGAKMPAACPRATNISCRNTGATWPALPMAIDAGASAVFGHGPHVVRPFELYRGKPVFYSLGNFVGYRSLSTQGKLAHSIVAEVRFSPRAICWARASSCPSSTARAFRWWTTPRQPASPQRPAAGKLDHRPVLNLNVNNTTNW